MSQSQKTFITECPICEAKVTSDVLHQMNKFYDEIGEPFQFSFVKCQVCGDPMVLMQDWYYDDNGGDFGSAVRVWPSPNRALSWDIPEGVRSAIKEAEVCFKARAYTASLIMCRRALEQLCVDKKIKKKSLFKMIESLREKGIIDGKLFQWSDVLRDKGNLAAHGSDFKPKKEDVSDLLDFTIAICDYVYVLEEKYQKFLERQSKK